MNKTPKFLNKNGTLTGHAFACGYIEIYRVEDKLKGQIEISNNSGLLWVTGSVKNGRILKTFKRVKDARKFARQYGKLNKKLTPYLC